MANVVVSAIATFNGKALKKGQKELSAFDKQAQQLGRTFSRVFAATAIVAYSKKAIHAFAADENAAKSLAVQLENTGNAFRVNEVEAYISSLQNLYGVLDDQLRPAFQTLLNATGSVTLSQKALETALNVSAGTGKDLESVVAAIAKGASGTTTALSRLGTGLDKATIASGDMNKIMAALDKKFAGQAQARLTTYAGKMDLLKVAAANATEIIGKGLIDALTAIGKDNSIDQAANSMNNFAVAIANTATGMGELIGQMKKILDSDVGKVLLGVLALTTLSKKLVIGGTAGLIAYDIGKNPKAISESENRSLGQKRLADRVKESKLIKDSVTYRTAENAALKAKTEMDKLKDKFDLERIGLTAALNAATDEETKLRIRAQIAILDNNEALAKKINAELEAAKGATNLADAFGGASSALEANIAKLRILSDTILQKAAIKGIETPGVYNPYAASSGSSASALETQIQKLQSLTDTIKQKAALKGIDASTVDYSVMPTLPNGMLDLTAPQNAASARLQAQADAYFRNQQEIKLTIDTSATGDRFAQLVAESLQSATRSGLSTSPAGSLP
jgi:hypothetical protein